MLKDYGDSISEKKRMKIEKGRIKSKKDYGEQKKGLW